MQLRKTKRRRGFAGMSPEKRREISRKGAQALHEQGLASKFTSETARAAAEKRYGRPTHELLQSSGTSEAESDPSSPN